VELDALSSPKQATGYVCKQPEATCLSPVSAQMGQQLKRLCWNRRGVSAQAQARDTVTSGQMVGGQRSIIAMSVIRLALSVSPYH
jgi:hypothetical protein